MDMREQIKKKFKKRRYAVLLSLMAGVLLFLLRGQFSHAADQIFIKFNEAKLDPAVTYDMTTSTMQLMLGTPDGDHVYDDERYKVEWTIEDTAARDVIASISPGTSKNIGIVKALSPGDVTVTLTVKDSMDGDAVLGSTTCNIRVVFSIDTSTDDSIYKFVHENDTARSLVMYSNSAPVNLGLNFGSANSSNTQWSSANDEVATVTQRGGLVSPVGAGKTQVIATYTPTGATETYTAYLDVYVIPRVSTTNGANYGTAIDAQLNSGEYLYTDTNFANNLEVIRSKIIWVVKKDDDQGNSKIIADSLGKDSDLISITPTASRSNELRIEGKAGEYDLYFYTYGSYDENVDNGTTAYTPTVVHLTIKSDIQDKTEILSIGDGYHFAESYNMTLEDFNECFSVDIKMAQGAPDYSEYADFDNTKAELTAKNVGNLVATLTVRSGREAYVRRILGLAENEALPAAFTTKIDITDNIRVNRTSMTIVVGQKEQLSVKLNSIYSGSITWESSDPNYVSVDRLTGLIEGKKVTTQDVVITVTLDAGNGLYKTATCTVKVEATVSGFTLNPGTDQQMLVGDHLTVVANIKQTVTLAPLRWISSNTSVFTVEQASDGKSAILTAVGGGRATLTVYSTVNNEYKSFEVTVRIPINEISFSAAQMQLELYKSGYNMKDEVKWGPTNATDTALTWASSDTSVVELDKDGYMKFKGAGTALVSVYPTYNPYNVMASCLVTIIGTPDSMTISQMDVTMNVGEAVPLLVDFNPKNTATGITWTPNDDGIVTVTYDEERRIATLTGKAPGTTNINVVTTEGLISNVKVSVKQPSTALNLTPKDVTLKTGDSVNLKATFTPANSTDTIVWKSYNTGVATVDTNGRVTGVKAGSTFIQATAYNGKVAGPTTVIMVTVQDGVKGVSLDSSEKTVRVDSSVTLIPIFNPATAFNKAMTWKASNSNVKIEAVGISNLKVTGVKAGTAMVTGTTTDGGFSVSCLITILPKQKENDTKVTVSPKTKYLAKGKSFYVTATVTGSSNKKVKWTSSKKSVATVTSGGKVKAKKLGTTYIKATAKDGSGAYARCKVRVVRKVKKIKLNRYSGRLLVGSTLKLKATVLPKNATIKSVKWTTNKKSIATVSSTGRVLGTGEGIVKIKASAKDGSGKSATCILHVVEPIEATGITVANSQITVAKGKIAQSGITLNPVNSTTKIKYHSDNPRVATVNKYGKIKTKRAGEATIYGTTSTGLYGYCDVLVVDLNRKAVTLRPYDTEQLHVNEISTGVTWYSRDINIATVSSTGLVTGRKRGITTIYAVVNGVKLGCRVNVTKLK